MSSIVDVQTVEEKIAVLMPAEESGRGVVVDESGHLKVESGFARTVSWVKDKMPTLIAQTFFPPKSTPLVPDLSLRVQEEEKVADNFSRAIRREMLDRLDLGDVESQDQHINSTSALVSRKVQALDRVLNDNLIVPAQRGERITTQKVRNVMSKMSRDVSKIDQEHNHHLLQAAFDIAHKRQESDIYRSLQQLRERVQGHQGSLVVELTNLKDEIKDLCNRFADDLSVAQIALAQTNHVASYAQENARAAWAEHITGLVRETNDVSLGSLEPKIAQACGDFEGQKQDIADFEESAAQQLEASLGVLNHHIQELDRAHNIIEEALEAEGRSVGENDEGDKIHQETEVAEHKNTSSKMASHSLHKDTSSKMASRGLHKDIGKDTSQDTSQDISNDINDGTSNDINKDTSNETIAREVTHRGTHTAQQTVTQTATHRDEAGLKTASY